MKSRPQYIIFSLLLLTDFMSPWMVVLLNVIFSKLVVGKLKMLHLIVPLTKKTPSKSIHLLIRKKNVNLIARRYRFWFLFITRRKFNTIIIHFFVKFLVASRSRRLYILYSSSFFFFSRHFFKCQNSVIFLVPNLSQLAPTCPIFLIVHILILCFFASFLYKKFPYYKKILRLFMTALVWHDSSMS